MEIITIDTDTYLVFPLMMQSLYDEIYGPEYVYSEERARAVTAMILFYGNVYLKYRIVKLAILLF